MIVHVLERARESGAIALLLPPITDVARAVEAAGGEVCMTRADHQSGTERLAEVVEKCGSVMTPSSSIFRAMSR
jgi:3-deoxy-manno-octulosonate cytidylyltransferase (CMP-KDO synthetase)